MDDLNSDDIALALNKVYHRNKQEQNKSSSTHKENDDERRKRAYQNAEAEFLARKVAKPSKVKRIKPFPLNEQQEDLIIPEFIRTSNHGPTDHTMAMEGKPYSLLIQMENGLIYMGVISQVMHIHWPGGIQNEIQRKIEKASEGELKFHNMQKQKPTLLADTRQYQMRLYPMHLNHDICQHDFLELMWGFDKDIANPEIKYGLGYSSQSRSFKYLTADGFFIDKLPLHIHQIFKQGQQIYDKARSENKIGKAIFTRLDLDKPLAGKGWTIPIFPWEKRQYFDIPDVRYINPNRQKPFKIMSHSKAKLPFEKQNIRK